MLCKQCGTMNDDEAQVCAYCGAPLQEPEDATALAAAEEGPVAEDAGEHLPGDSQFQQVWDREISGLWADAVGADPFDQAEVEAAGQALLDAQGQFQFLEGDAAAGARPAPEQVDNTNELGGVEDSKADDLEAEAVEVAVEDEVAAPEDGFPEAEFDEVEGAAAEAEDEGADFEDDASETVEAAPPEASEQLLPAQLYCLRCGTPIEEGVDVCPTCGATSEEFITNGAPAVGFVRASARHSSYEDDFDVFDRFNSRQLGYIALGVAVLVFVIVGGLASIVGDLAFFKGGRGGLDPIAQEEQAEQADEEAQPEEDAEETPEEEPVPVTEAVAPADGLTPLGNLTNGGYVLEHDGWVYYAIPEGKGEWHTSAIGRMREDGSQQSLIYSVSGSDPLIWHLNVMGDRLYFSQDSGSWSANLMSVGLNGSDSRTEGTVMPGTLCQTYEGRVYSSDWSGLWSFDPTWVEGWNCYGGPASDCLWRVWGSPADREQGKYTVYYFYQGGSTVSASNNLWEEPWGHDILALGEGRTLVNVQPTDEGLWLLVDINGDGFGDEVMRSELDGTGLATYAATTAPATRMNAGSYGVFVVVQEGTAMRIERIDVDDAAPVEGEGEEEGAAEAAAPTVTVYYRSDPGVEVAYPSVYGKYLYFGLVGNDQSSLVRMELGHPGSKPEEIV